MQYDGFLGQQNKAWSVEFRRRHAQLFELCLDLNRECHRAVDGLSIERENGRQVLSACLFARCLDHYQATLLLISEGMVAPGRASLRNLLEAVFALRAISSDAEMLRAYIHDDQVQRLKLVHKAKATVGGGFAALRGAVSTDFIEDLKKEIAAKAVRHVTTEELARAAGMHSWYQVIYSVLNPAVHAHVRDLKQYLVLDSGKKIVGLVFGPDDKDAPMLLAPAAQAVALALDSIADVFKLSLTEPVETVIKRIDKTLKAAGNKHRQSDKVSKMD